MVATLGELVAALGQAFEQEDYAQCARLLAPVKVQLVKNKLLIPQGSLLLQEQYVADLAISRRVLEIGALCNVRLLKLDEFHRFYSQLQQFYFDDNVLEKLPESHDASKIVALQLLAALARGDVTSFHAQLEFLGFRLTDLEQDQYLSYPIKLDRWLMEGSYQKAWDLLDAGSKIPEFDVFNDTLRNALRDEIAKSTELAYDSIPLSNVKALLFFSSEKDAEQFVLQKGWSITKSIVNFPKVESEVDDMELDAGDELSKDNTLENKAIKNQLNVIEKTLDYAINLETIV